MHPTSDREGSDEQTDSDARLHPERRRDVRVDLDAGELEVKIGSLADFLQLYALNVSSGGMFIAADELLPVGERFAFAFRIPGREAIFEGEAEVVRHCDGDGEPRGMGVRFLELTSRARELLRQMVRAQKQALIAEE